jgi:class 3 adenylate cyclase
MANLPSGTVTFLFTDIEDSAALWERDQKAMAEAVERHFQLLRAAIEALAA